EAVVPPAPDPSKPRAAPIVYPSGRKSVDCRERMRYRLAHRGGDALMSTTVANLWKAALAERMAPELAKEIDVFETQLELRKQGKLDERVFAETRLRRGAYGQRYDNGQRHDGLRTQTLEYPN